MPTPLTALVDAVAPARLGRSFRSMLAAVVVMNIGDGIVLAAGPLLVASLTRDAFLVSLAFLCEFLPALVFGTVAGVVVDRVDRRRLVVVVNLLRAGILAVLAAIVATGSASIAAVLVTLLVLGTAETFADLASSSLLPRMVPRRDLGIANARLSGSFLLTNQLVGPPIGAFLFAAGMAIPFAADAVAFALGAVLIARIAASDVAHRGRPTPRTGARAADGEDAATQTDPPRSTLGSLSASSARASVAAQPPTDAHAGAHDLRVQRHVRRGLVGAGPLRHRAAAAWTASASGC